MKVRHYHINLQMRKLEHGWFWHFEVKTVSEWYRQTLTKVPWFKSWSMFNDMTVALLNIIQVTLLGENPSSILFMCLSTLRKLNCSAQRKECDLPDWSIRDKQINHSLLKSSHPLFPLRTRCLQIAQILFGTSNP